MKNTLKVNVRASHIARGEREQCETCPIALAIRAITRRRAQVSDLIEVDTQPGMTHRFYTMPKKAHKFIARFDAGRTVRPFTFVAREQR